MDLKGIWQPVAVVNTWPVSFGFYIAALLGLWTAGTLFYAASRKRKTIEIDREGPGRPDGTF